MSIRFQSTVTDETTRARYSASLELDPRRLAWLGALESSTVRSA